MPISTDAKIFVAGHRGLVGSALVRALNARGLRTLLLRTHAELDLTDQAATEAFFAENKPDYVFLAAARVGGILANSTQPADFIRDNLAIALNVIDASHRHGVKKLLNLGSTCIYPSLAPQPIAESALLTGPLEPTNRAYAIAKIAAIEMCDHYRTQYGCDFISAMPTNLYGPHDNFDPVGSHVIPGMIRKFWEAREAGHAPVNLWGSGAPLREFLYSEDLADACLFLMDRVSEPGPINVGSGEEVSIRALAEKIQHIVGHRGEVHWDHSKPDGTPRKLSDVTRLRNMGWQAKVGLDVGLREAVTWFGERVVRVSGTRRTG